MRSTLAKYKVESLVQFVQRTEELGSKSELVLFRGQAKAGDLLPGIARSDPTRNTVAAEKQALQQLQLQGASLLSNAGTTTLDLLVLAQHFGLKTRLLDWSSNPLAALWFACADYKAGDAFVYALEADTFLEKDVYDKDPFATAKTRVFQARLNNDRIVAQEGWFTLHRYSRKAGRFVALEVNTEIGAHIHRIRVPADKRESILVSLDKHGVNARSLFPGLDGLCQHLNRRHGLA